MPHDIALATFITDIPTLVIPAFLIVLAFHFRARKVPMDMFQHEVFVKRIERTLLYLALAFMLVVELATYAQLPYAMWVVRHVIGEQTMNGTDFMWNGYFHWPFSRMCHAMFDVVGGQATCTMLEPTADPKDWHWWPVVALCFWIQWKCVRGALHIGMEIGDKMLAEHPDSIPPQGG